MNIPPARANAAAAADDDDGIADIAGGAVNVAVDDDGIGNETDASDNETYEETALRLIKELKPFVLPLGKPIHKQIKQFLQKLQGPVLCRNQNCYAYGAQHTISECVTQISSSPPKAVSKMSGVVSLNWSEIEAMEEDEEEIASDKCLFPNRLPEMPNSPTYSRLEDSDEYSRHEDSTDDESAGQDKQDSPGTSSSVKRHLNYFNTKLMTPCNDSSCLCKPLLGNNTRDTRDVIVLSD